MTGKETPPSDVTLVLLYPGDYVRKKHADGSESYVERRGHDLGGDPDFWVDAEEVDAWRKKDV